MKLSVLLTSLALACASQDTEGTRLGDDAGASAGGRSGAPTSTGGAASGGSPADECAVDAGTSECEVCLQARCCDALGDCLADSRCAAALAAHQACFEDRETRDPTACFVILYRRLAEDSAIAPVPACIVQDCAEPCRGPVE